MSKRVYLEVPEVRANKVGVIPHLNSYDFPHISKEQQIFNDFTAREKRPRNWRNDIGREGKGHLKRTFVWKIPGASIKKGC